MGSNAHHVLWRVVHPLAEGDALLYLHADPSATWSRASIAMEPGTSVSYGTYFGAFPSSYWRHWTGVAVVELVFEVDAETEVAIFGTDATGATHLLQRRRVQAGVSRLGLALGAETDGWVWPEFRALSEPVTVRDITWQTSQPPVRASRVGAAITTFDRESDCIALLQSLSEPGLAESVPMIVVVDQGRRELRQDPGFAAVAELLSGRLRVHRQGNLGGSGGFSRGMLEAVDGDLDFALLLDDDVRLEPESVLRLAAFAAYARRPTIVGAQMLSSVEPLRLHSFGEHVDRRTMWWSAIDPSLSALDLGAGIRGIPRLSRRVDVDFNGWWMCLVPTRLVRDAGASLPYFIKWDDAEFGLRAAAHDVPTVTLPGAALWHVPWTAKDDGLDWQAYFQFRNRVLTALLHGGRGVLSSSFAQDVNHLLCGQYGSAELRNIALRDILLGPAHLDPVLRAGPSRATAILQRSGQAIVPSEELPATVASGIRRPAGRAAMVARAVRVMIHQFRPPRVGGPVPRLPRVEGKWWSLGLLDTAVVEAASGTGAFAFRRDRSVAKRQLRRAVLLRWRMLVGWEKLARRYQDASTAAASAEAWGRRFEDAAPTGALRDAPS